MPRFIGAGLGLDTGEFINLDKVTRIKIGQDANERSLIHYEEGGDVRTATYRGNPKMLLNAMQAFIPTALPSFIWLWGAEPEGKRPTAIGCFKLFVAGWLYDASFGNLTPVCQDGVLQQDNYLIEEEDGSISEPCMNRWSSLDEAKCELLARAQREFDLRACAVKLKAVK